MKVIQTQKAFKAHEETKLLEKITQIALFFFLEFKHLANVRLSLNILEGV